MGLIGPDRSGYSIQCSGLFTTFDAIRSGYFASGCVFEDTTESKREALPRGFTSLPLPNLVNIAPKQASAGAVYPVNFCT